MESGRSAMARANCEAEMGCEVVIAVELCFAIEVYEDISNFYLVAIELFWEGFYAIMDYTDVKRRDEDIYCQVHKFCSRYLRVSSHLMPAVE